MFFGYSVFLGDVDISDGVLVHDGVHWEGVRRANSWLPNIGYFPTPYSLFWVWVGGGNAEGGRGIWGLSFLVLLSRMLWLSTRPTQSLVVLSVWLGTTLLGTGEAVGRVYFPARRMVQEENGPQSAADVGAPT